MMRGAQAARAGAGSSTCTLVEDLDGVLGSAEAKPTSTNTLEKFPVSEIALTRWGTHLGNRHWEDVTRHGDRKGGLATVSLLLLLLFLLLGPKPHLLEDEGLGLLML